MFRSILPLAVGATLAGGLSQFPEFAQQYTQRVGGAFDEIHAVTEALRLDAEKNGKTVTEAIAEYNVSDNDFFRDRGLSMQDALSREAFLQQHYAALTSSNGYDQLVVFLQARDNGIAEATLADYKPAVPVTFTGLAHAALGFLVGFLLLALPRSVRRRRVAA